MDYPYENLSPETFQHFCQALLTKEFPGIQCFPVAQPDGGRDATQRYFDFRSGRQFSIFQVKFVRRPLAEPDPHKWILDIVSSEVPKIRKQIPAGAKMYVLMTNVSGTAHPSVGSIDVINATLEKELGLPATCWWRDDLSRKLDSSWDLKWKYPELMTGPDLIRLIIEKHLSEGNERRASAIRAFVTTQFTIEQHVKFKQVDLDNRLLDLFIDVPIGPGSGPKWQRANRWPIQLAGIDPDFWAEHQEPDADDEATDDSRPAYMRRIRKRKPGAASVLLSRSSAEEFPFSVLEGAPGQGKSTITQYVCQVHRMRLLNKTDELLLIAEDHRNSAFRLPIKVDLRDFAAWLVRRNPFSAEAQEVPYSTWEKSLEAFLSALIRHHSGGAAFDVSDLHAVIKLSSVILVLDGLDEVADIKRRTDVVHEISKGSERLKSVAASLQVVVTSRPAAFENSPGLPAETFLYLSLDSVSQELIDEYAAKWLKARRLDDRESVTVKRILREKLNQPHLRDLARNPMQLAILLNLIHTRGTSLPDKRTALYDNYVELFFNRESEKSSIVRDNRDLLIDIHRYLAWLLHVEAEHSDESSASRPTGAIEESRLKNVLREYLAGEGRDPDLTELLFTGLIERVVALVSRVQGTYEFEVQPLREYFAARFLHETAPYSPTGNEKRGTRPDRFDAISRNFYWLNIVRFYAGCYSKGELPSLIDRLSELLRDSKFCYLSHPRMLGATLLGDWVFTQHPKSVTEVIRLILDGIGLRFLLTSNSRRQNHAQPLTLAAGCGKAELVAKCLEKLRSAPPPDYALDLIDLLRSNASREELLPLWQAETILRSTDARTRWMEFGLNLGCLSTIAIEDLRTMLTDSPLADCRISLLLSARRSDVLESNNEYFHKTIEALLARRARVKLGVRKQAVLESFGQAIDPSVYALAFQNPVGAPLEEVLGRMSRPATLRIQETFEGTSSSFEMESCKKVIAVARKACHMEAKLWAADLTPWEMVVSVIQEQFGDRWSVYHLANIASGIKASAEKCTDTPDLFDSSKSICRRSRYARLRAGTPTWWSKEFNEASDLNRQMLVCALYFTWASSNTITETLKMADRIVHTFPQNAWEVFFDSVEQAVLITRPRSNEKTIELVKAETAHSISSHRTSALLRLRAKAATAYWLYENWVPVYSTADNRVLRIFQQNAIDRLLSQSDDPGVHLSVLAAGYQNGVLAEPYASHHFVRLLPESGIPLKLALQVVEKADTYPSFLVAAAEARCREHTAKLVQPVGKIAEAEHWFASA